MAILGRSYPTNRSVQVNRLVGASSRVNAPVVVRPVGMWFNRPRPVSHVYTIRSPYFNTTLVAAFGSFALSGQAVTFDDGLLSSFSSYTLTGEPVTFSLSALGHVVRPAGLLSRPKPNYRVFVSQAPPVANAAVLVAGVGSFTLTGEAVTFDNGLASAFGSYALTGEAATTDYQIGAVFGSYVLTGNAATLSGTGLVPDTSGQTVLMPGPSGPAFTRKRFRELMDAIRAAEAAADKAKQRARQKALHKAADAARKLQDEAEATEAEFNPEPIRKALEAASGAKKLQDAIEQSKQVVEMVAAMLRAAEEEDEEEAVSLLLMS